MEKCNLVFNSTDTPYRAISFLEKNGFEIENESETDTLFVLHSFEPYPPLLAWEVGKAFATDRKVVVLADLMDDGDVYLEDWLFESACAAFNIRTGRVLEMIEM